MAIIGYIFCAEHYLALERDKLWMQKFGCDQIILEEGIQEKLRPQWRKLLCESKERDTIVVSKLSNAVRGVRELGVFLDLCTQYDIRLISINDKIDSKGELFPETSVGDVLKTIGAISFETMKVRQGQARVSKKRIGVKPKTLKAGLRIDREKTVVNMYNSGYSIDDIWKASGYKSRTSVFRVLNRNGVQLNRGPHQGPIKKKLNNY